MNLGNVCIRTNEARVWEGHQRNFLDPHVIDFACYMINCGNKQKSTMYHATFRCKQVF